ncbi:peptidoglycan-binding domain-containing protein [Photobacterium chitinilyticum]|uniref:Peptidoglycan-binding protein n=1 Tax=Photobacterium chitinilyticum TaxID=2485123 RepID=A0A3S3UKP8_9GAMM|nr:peptidoglycan-binding domain-containing protein [Photobacterium chitinilyticum]RWX56224.1 peptidoglycan-binding protein [Photobacterium chitinilyticum]
MTKTELEAVDIGNILYSTISDVLRMSGNMGFKGDVDIGIKLNTTISKNTAKLVALVNTNQSSQSTIEVKLATRIHLSDEYKPKRFVFRGELSLGAHGKVVEELQAALNHHLKSGLIIDGDFGKKTQNAVKAFQTLHDLQIKNGTLDKKTGSKLSQI